MGAAAGKAIVEDLAAGGAATAQAEDRLAAAEHAMLGSAGVDGTSGGIWDAAATCANGSLLAAIDEIIVLKEIHAFPMASAARRRMDGALRVAMSRLMAEFLRLRVWDASKLSGRTGLRFVVEKLSVSAVAARCVSPLAFLTDGSSRTTGTTGELSLCTVDDLFYASGESRSASSDTEFPADARCMSPLAFRTDGSSGTMGTTGELCLCTVDELIYASDGSRSASPDTEFPADELRLLFPASLSVLHEISLRVIRAGFADELLHTFPNAPCDVLERFLSILQAEGFLDTGRTISFEDAEWWTTEDMIRRWILATKLIGKALVAMKTQLHAQSIGAFDRFKNEYLLAIAKRSTFVLLRFADGFTNERSPEKLVYVLEMYEVLGDVVVPGLTLVFAGRDVESILRQVGVILAKLARAVRIMAGGVVAKIRAGGGSNTAARGVGVHPLARYAMACVESLAPHRGALDVILGDGGERVSSLGDLVTELVECLEASLDEISALYGGAQGGSGGLRHLFLANNTSFILKHADANGEVKLEGGGDEWAAQRRSRIERHVTSYVEASWAPVVACFDAAGAGVGNGKAPAETMAKFNSAIEEAYRDHLCCEVPDPALRAALREAVSERVVAAYGGYLLRNPKLGKSARYNAESLTGMLMELFEGEAAETTKSYQ